MSQPTPYAAIVTGSGGTGCGRAIALRFARDGAAVIVSDIDETGGAETVRLIEEGGGRATFMAADIRDENQVKALVGFCERHFGAVSVLVNNASAPHATQEGIVGWAATLETDLMGALFAIRWAAEAMRRGGGGTIVNITSISALWHGRKTPGGFDGYDVAKSGLIRATTRLVLDPKMAGVRINCLAPGWIGTGEVRRYWEDLSPDDRRQRGVPERLLTPEQVADIVLRIAKDETLNGRIISWWSEQRPRLIAWGDRGYSDFEPFPE